MRPKWTGDALKKMHINGITQKAVAEEMGVSPQYVCMILSGSRETEGSRKKFAEALEVLMSTSQASSSRR